MTTRLKKQLANLGVDASSSRANESFCLIGTPLPPLEKSKDTGEFVPLWKQEVRDEKGRRRLHGAFTGGFSAGYFNTVGSKEGWTPSTFVSSRSDRSKAKQARPEDFMDEEDLAEIAASRDLVDITEELDITGGKAQADADDEESSSMARKLEAALLPPPSDSVGARILRKMGWKVGQGIGPRLNYRQKRLQDAALGLAGDDMDPDMDAEGGEESKHTYAPRDTPLLLPSKKTDTHGHGYQPGMSLYEGSGTKQGSAPTGPNLSAGFGLGALNDADEDDIDVYDSGMARGKTRMAYDDMDVDDQETIRIGGSRRGKQPEHASSQNRSSSSASTFRDGRPVLNGFVIASQPVAEDKWYPLPDIPGGWKPDPTRVWRHGSQDASTSKVTDPQNDTKTFQDWKKGVSANERGSILGETPLPAATRSIFEYMSQKDRERLQRAAASVGSDLKDAPASQPMPPPPPPTSIHIPRTEPYIAKAALFGFQPYQSDPVKHERYNIYLNSQSHIDNSYPPLQPSPGQSIEAFNKEVSDYAQSAAVFKPLSGAMAGRFTSAAIVESGPKAHEGLYMPDLNKPAEEDPAPEQIKEEEKVAEDPKENAVRHGMYGPLTRSVKKWAPARLLCKRFGVKDPEPGPEEDVDNDQPTASSSAAPPPPKAEPLAIEPVEEAAGQAVSEPSEKPSGPRDLANVGLGDDEYQAQDVLTYERPPLDVFKAIFASDSEDSDDEETPAETTAESSLAHIQHSTTVPGPNGADTGPVNSISSTPSVTAAPAPPPPKPKLVASESVDLATFKPTFVSRTERHDGASKEKDRKKTKTSDKSLVSFTGDGEDGEDIGLGAPKVKKRKDKSKHRDKDQEKERHKKRKMITTMQEGEDDMWVEKPIPMVVMTAEAATAYSEVQNSTAPKGRKTAADFM